MVSATKRSPGGVRALAAPVRDSKGNVVVDFRNEFRQLSNLPNSKIKRTAKVVRETAREVS